MVQSSETLSTPFGGDNGNKGSCNKKRLSKTEFENVQFKFQLNAEENFFESFMRNHFSGLFVGISIFV